MIRCRECGCDNPIEVEICSRCGKALHTDVFISYSRKDYIDGNGKIIKNNAISKIKHALNEESISCWFDEDGIYSGDEFASIITKAIRTSSVFLFISSKNSNESLWASNEIAVAMAYRKPIIPFRIDDSPYNDSVMMKIVALDYIECKEINRAITQLIKAIRYHLSHIKHTNHGSETSHDVGSDILSESDSANVDKTVLINSDPVSKPAKRSLEDRGNPKPDEKHLVIASPYIAPVAKDSINPVDSILIKTKFLTRSYLFWLVIFLAIINLSAYIFAFVKYLPDNDQLNVNNQCEKVDVCPDQVKTQVTEKREPVVNAEKVAEKPDQTVRKVNDSVDKTLTKVAEKADKTVTKVVEKAEVKTVETKKIETPKTEPKPVDPVKTETVDKSSDKPMADTVRTKTSSAPVNLFIDGKKMCVMNNLPYTKAKFTVDVSADSGLKTALVSCMDGWYRAALDGSTGVMTVSFEENASEESRNGKISVTIGNEKVDVYLKQNGRPNRIASNQWYTKLTGLLANPDYEVNGDRYRGSLVQRIVRDGAGLYLWSNGIMYIGEWKSNHKQGHGIDIMPQDLEFAGLPGCRIIVTEYSSGTRNGNMSCYNSSGILLYDGPVSAGRPSAPYPASSPDPSKKFDYVTDGSGYYIGETLNGQKHGYGVYVTSSGNAWVGTWSRDKKLDGRFF